MKKVLEEMLEAAKWPAKDEGKTPIQWVKEKIQKRIEAKKKN